MDQQLPTPKIQQVIEIMRSQGYTDEQISELSAELAKNAYAQLYTEAMASFTEEDLTALDACATDEEANQKIQELYPLRTGQDPEQQVQQFIELFAQNFLDEYAKSQQSSTSQNATEAQVVEGDKV